MSKVVKEYTLPVLGQIEIIREEGNYRPHGDYYARIEKFGLSGRFSKSAEEAEKVMLNHMDSYLLNQKKGLG